MKKLFCMIALGAISLTSVFAAVPINHALQTDTTKVKSNSKKIKTHTPKAKPDSLRMR